MYHQVARTVRGRLLAAPAVVGRARDVGRYHSYVSSDPTVQVTGTELPLGPGDVLGVGDVEAAVSALMRVPDVALRRRGRARDLAVTASRTLTPATHAEIAARFATTRRTVARKKPGMTPEIRLVERVARDPRFFPLDRSDLRARWPAYRRSA